MLQEHGRSVDNNVLDVLRGYNSTVFGAVGAPSVPGMMFLLQTLALC